MNPVADINRLETEDGLEKDATKIFNITP